MDINVLYLGMANDILTPFLLEPNLTNLYVIDLFDDTYSSDKTLNGQRRDIKNKLKTGIDIKEDIRIKYPDVILKDPTNYKPDYSIDLKHKAIITKETDDGEVWTLEFILDGICRKLISYYDRNFEDIWPKEVTNISHIIGIGAYAVDLFIMNFDESAINKMFEERTTEEWTYYECNYGKNWHPVHPVYNHISKKNIQKTQNPYEWIKDILYTHDVIKYFG